MRTLPLALFFSCLAFFTTNLSAQSYRCQLSENGYTHAITSMVGTTAERMKSIKWWSPETFVINQNDLIFDNEWRLPIVGGDREKNYQAKYKTSKFRVTYYITINPFEGSGVIYLYPQSEYKRVGPVRYSCSSTGGSSNVQNSVYNPFQQEFNKLTSCNKKYVQQFLKGQNLYSGTVDGIWGAGTAEGLRKAKDLSAFKNLTTGEMFEKLRLNPICN